jgi:hypothetical protein
VVHLSPLLATHLAARHAPAPGATTLHCDARRLYFGSLSGRCVSIAAAEGIPDVLEAIGVAATVMRGFAGVFGYDAS